MSEKGENKKRNVGNKNIGNNTLLNKGSYCLIMKLDFDRKIKIGKLGIFDFPEGYYVYVGSAMKNLKQRIIRHFSSKKKLKWHIDYFLEHSHIIKVVVFPSNKRLECKISRFLSKYGSVIAEKFGSTDCDCKTHLYYFVTKKELNNAINKLKREMKNKI